MTRTQTLLAAVPKGTDKANIPKAMKVFATTLGDEMDAHKTEITTEVSQANQQLRDQVEQMTKNLRYDQIMADAQARAYGLAWMAG